jgi:hypothetical protein
MSFEKGDRVTVAGLPGVVSYINGNGSLDIEFDDNEGYYTDYVPASIVEKIVEPLKVGDTIEGEDAYAALPLGAVLTDTHDDTTGHGLLFRTNAGFTDRFGNAFGPRNFRYPRTVAYLPPID